MSSVGGTSRRTGVLAFDVITARQRPDRAGFEPEVRSRVLLSAEEFGSYALASDTAAAFAAAARRGMPLAVLPRH